MKVSLLSRFEKVENYHWWWEGRRELIRQFLQQADITRVLDVGMGTGNTVLFIQSMYPDAEVIGMDNDPESIRFARRKGIKKIVRSDATHIPFPDKSFDAVLFLDVLEHIPDHLKALDEAKRVLRKNGIVIITAPALKFIWSIHDENQNHCRRYTRREIQYLANRAGLKVEFLGYFNFLLSAPIIIMRLLSNLKSFSFLSEYDSSLNYDIARKKFINRLIRKMFIGEISLLKKIRYPIGISVAALLRK